MQAKQSLLRQGVMVDDFAPINLVDMHLLTILQRKIKLAALGLAEIILSAHFFHFLLGFIGIVLHMSCVRVALLFCN